MRYQIFTAGCALLLMYGISFSQENFNIERVGSIFTEWYAVYDVICENNLAYVATHYCGVVILDIEDPANPRIIGYWDENQGSSIVSKIVLTDQWLYLWCDGWHRVDISDPHRPVTVGTFADSASHIEGDSFLAYRQEDNGIIMEIVDLTDINNPQILGNYESERSIIKYYISNSILYLCDENYQIELVDISDPQNPHEIVILEEEIFLRSVAEVGDRTYLFGADRWVYIYNFTNLENPELISRFRAMGVSDELVIQDDLAYMAMSDWINGLQIFDISDPEMPEEVGRYSIDGQCSSISLSGSLIMLGNNRYGMAILDVTQPGNIEEIKNLGVRGDVRMAAFSGDYAYVDGSNTGGIWIVDISNPEFMREVGVIEVDSTLGDIIIENDIAYVAEKYGALWIFDVSDPLNPRQLSYIEPIESHDQLVLEGNFLYCDIRNRGRDEEGVRIYNVENPESPNYLGLIDLHLCAGIDIEDELLYVIFDGAIDKFKIYNIADIDNPELISEYGDGVLAPVRDLVVQENIAYIEGIGGFFAIDVNNPNNPELLGNIAIGATKIYIQNDIALLVSSYHGLNVVDISNPADMTIVGRYNTPGYCLSTNFYNGLIYQCDQMNFSAYRLGPISPAISVNPVAFDFGEVFLRETDTLEVSVSNIGVLPLRVDRISIRHDYFYVHGDIAELIEPNSSANFKITFSPEMLGNYNTDLMISSNDPERGEISIPLQGIGIGAPVIGIELDTLNYDTLEFGHENTIELEINNIGQIILTVFDIYIDGEDSEHFFVDFWGAEAIEVDSVKRYVTIYDPLESGLHNATLVIESDDPERGIIEILMKGVCQGGNGAIKAVPKIPDKFFMEQAYPNPFNSNTLLRYGLPHGSNVNLTLLDLNGRIVRHIDFGNKVPGYYIYYLQTDGLPTGVYLISLNTSSEFQSQKITLIK